LAAATASSPHQIAVIGLRSKQQIADKLKKRRIWNEHALGAHRDDQLESQPLVGFWVD